MSKKTTVAVFDLDGTLSWRDTYLPYLFGFMLRNPWRASRLIGLPWVVIRMLIGKTDNTEVKRKFLEAFLGNVPRRVVESWTEKFVDQLLRRGLRRDGIKAVNRHRVAGDVVVLMSASLDIYVHEIAMRLGIDHVICTKVQWEEGRISGKLASPNCYGAEKALQLARLKEAYAGADIIVYADHHTDIPMLLMANRGVMVNPTRKTARLGQRHRIEERRWT